MSPRVTKLRCELKCHFSRSENITSSESLRVRYASDAENVASIGQEATHHQNAAGAIGGGLSLFAENKLSAQDLGACVPTRSSGVMTWTKEK